MMMNDMLRHLTEGELAVVQTRQTVHGQAGSGRADLPL